MSKRRKYFLIGVVVIFVAIQFYRPPQTNPLVDPSHTMQSQLQLPPRVAAILDRSCMDCHSDATRWPMIGRIAPVSWWLANNVEDARRSMNFSEWTLYRPSYAIANLGAISEAVTEKTMPPDGYMDFHPQSRLSADDRKTLARWAGDTWHSQLVLLLDTPKVAKTASP
ncbi:MAG TPA: heme-binding domain-containing protein [Verrucomicrobiae bacterium]|jgi:hypothetical protein